MGRGYPLPKVAFFIGEKMKSEWPLWWCLEPATQALLMKFQWDEYGYRLTIPPMLSHGHIDTDIESPEEIARIVKQPPRHQKRVV